jgi:hypothetical protein
MMSAAEEVTPVPVVLPELVWVPTRAHGDRHGARVVVHRWGVRFTTLAAEAKSYRGVTNEFLDPANEASAHVVYPGSAVSGGHIATQMVAWADAAWTESHYNPTSDEIESADAIWLGHDWYGFHVLARMVAHRLHERQLPPVWSAERGFCRHGDLGSLGGGHTACPTTDPHLFRLFASTVQHEYARGGFTKDPKKIGR